MRIGHHRKFTTNHVMHVDWREHPMFVKVSPNPAESAEEVAGHHQLRGFYPVPALLAHRRLGRWAVLAYERHRGGIPDTGLLLDEINAADETGDFQNLDACLARITDRYADVIGATLCHVPQRSTVSKLYGERALSGGRLDAYYGGDRPILTLPDGEQLRPSDLTHVTLLVNGRPRRLDFAALLTWLRRFFDPERRVWCALTQGDPTDVNIGTAPVWFDYDTGGLNALAGEFACFLWYQHLQGGWLVPTYNPAAFVDHSHTWACREQNRPAVSIERMAHDVVRIDYHHLASPARRYTMTSYLKRLVHPLAARIGVTDLLGWLRPYLALRILGVYHLGDLDPADAALSLAYLAEVLDPSNRLETLLGLHRTSSVEASAHEQADLVE